MPNMYIPAGWPDAVVEEVRECFGRVQNVVSGKRVWDRLFTPVERSKLGNNFPAAWPDGGIVTMWMKVRGVSAHRAVVDMARSLNLIDASTHRWLLVETGELSDDPEEALEIASCRSELVLSEIPRTVIWRGDPIMINWQKHNAFWVYLLTLAKAAKENDGIDASFFPKSRKPDYHIKLKSRLTNMEQFPADLEPLIVTHNSQQRLDLPPESICILEMVNKVTVRELVCFTR